MKVNYHREIKTNEQNKNRRNFYVDKITYIASSEGNVSNPFTFF